MGIGVTERDWTKAPLLNNEGKPKRARGFLFMALGDGIRRNIASVDPAERALLRDGLIALNTQVFPGDKSQSPPGGVSWWFKQDEIHQATHVHDGPEFLPWHREIVNRLEEMLRQINPQLSLHYWDWKQDPRNIPNANLGGGLTGSLNLFDHSGGPVGEFMGYGGSTDQFIGQPWLNAKFYDPQAGTSGHPPDRDVSLNPADPPGPSLLLGKGCHRFVSGSPASPQEENNVLNTADYADMRVLLEQIHNDMHGFVNMGGQHVSFRDPFVFLLHSNVDRIFALWQTEDPVNRLDPSKVYGSETNKDVVVGANTQNLNHNVEPWSTGHSTDQFGVVHNTRPWYAPENEGVPHTYKDRSIVLPPCYDTNLSTFQVDEIANPLNAGTNRFQVIFNDVPEEETTWRAAVIRVCTCDTATFHVKLGTEPAAPFLIAIGQDTAANTEHRQQLQEVRIWFQYTAGAVGTAPHTDGPVNTTIRCDETGQEFQFELRANTIHRLTVAVQMVLDQSLSMADPAGTSGLTRLEVLKDAAKLFATVIQDNNGLGIIRFDDDAYPPSDPTYPGMAITKIQSDNDRQHARDVIDAHGAHGNTSVGDGLIMGHGQIVPPALPAGTYDRTALLLFTDGLENRLATIDDAIGMGAVDTTTFAVGLGNEFQVNTGKLNQIAGSTGGNLLLSGILTDGTDDFYRVKKFFLQILATVTNTSIVRDPTGYINIGTKIKIPFQLSEADINCRVILLTDFPVVKLSVETPNGKIIDEANAAGFGVTFKTNGTTKTSSFNLPVAFQATKIQGGAWNVILEVDADLDKRILAELREKNPAAAASLNGKGARYCVSMHSFSNLRMNASVSQNAYNPGSTLTLRAKLKEYDLPVEKRATVRTDIEYPDHTNSVLSLAEIQPGTFESAMIANMPGIYRLTTVAEGVTYRGTPFTREQILNAAVFRDRPEQPVGTVSKDDLCRLLSSLLEEKNFSRDFEARLKKEGINLDAVRQGLKAFCQS
jgi:Common central domain of tyrosinase